MNIYGYKQKRKAVGVLLRAELSKAKKEQSEHKIRELRKAVNNYNYSIQKLRSVKTKKKR